VPPLDLPGVGLSTVALIAIVFALIEGVDAGWTSPVVLCAAAVGVAAGVGFFAVELRRAQPLFDVRVLARRRVAAGAFAILASYVATLGMLFLLPRYVQYVQDRPALASGLELAPFGLGLGVFAPVSGRLVTRYGPRVVLLAGLLTAAAGFVPLLLLSADSSPALVVLRMGIVGCGMGLSFPPATAVIMNDLGLEKAGHGAAVNQLARQVGGARGVAVVGSVFAAIYAAQVADDSRVPASSEGVNRGRDRRRDPPPRRGPCRSPPRRRQELRRGGPLGPGRVHGGRAPLGGERRHRTVRRDSG
jgi:predicted MFS family arabinose efflux permease